MLHATPRFVWTRVCGLAALLWLYSALDFAGRSQSPTAAARSIASAQESPPTGELAAVEGGVALVRSIDVQTGTQLGETRYPEFGSPGSIRWAWPGRSGEVLLAAVSYDQGTQTIHALATDPQDGSALWQIDVATPDSIENAPQALMQAQEGSIFLGSMTVAAADDQTWTLYKLTGPFADDLFANGYER